MIVRAAWSIAAAVIALVLPQAVRAQAATAQPAAPPPAQTAAQALAQAAPPAPEGRPIKVYLRAGLKTHAAGQHDYPQFLADWSKMLTERGAIVDGSFHFPTAEEIADVDVIVMYKGDAGYMTANEKAVLETFLRRGGGLVSFHDTLCGDDPQYQANILGGAKKHGERNFSQGEITYTIADTPSAKGHAGEIVPQIWTYENTMAGGTQPYRAFVWMQGHNYTNFADPKLQPMILKGIAWAAKKPYDALMTVRPARGRSSGQ